MKKIVYILIIALCSSSQLVFSLNNRSLAATSKEVLDNQDFRKNAISFINKAIVDANLSDNAKIEAKKLLMALRDITSSEFQRLREIQRNYYTQISAVQDKYSKEKNALLEEIEMKKRENKDTSALLNKLREINIKIMSEVSSISTPSEITELEKIQQNVQETFFSFLSNLQKEFTNKDAMLNYLLALLNEFINAAMTTL